MILIIIFSIIMVGIFLYFKAFDENKVIIKPKNNDFQSTLYREINKIKEDDETT